MVVEVAETMDLAWLVVPMYGGSEESVNETFRSVELPTLPSDANALSFGDWLATIQPLIADVSVSAEEWWAVTLKGVDELYTQWLASDPLQRLRLDTGTSSAATRWPRTERRMTSLLLQAVPDNIKAEAVAARKLSVTHLLFTLFVKFQPGGQGERVTLIRFLTELKTTGSMVDLAQNLRQWRRWWNRARELAVMLPDPVILAGVLTRASDAIAKSGAQAAHRLSVCRQQLQIDTRPNLDSIKTFAELLQAETEEQALGAGGIGGAGKTTVPFVKAAALGASSTTATLATGNTQESKAAGVEFKGDCRFWLSDKGCRRGDRCKFKHGLLSPKENRCFFCSGLNHTRRDCPYVKKEFGKEENVKVAKVQVEDSPPSSPEREPLKVKVEEATGASGKKTEAEAGSGAAGGPMPNKSDPIDTLMGEASALLKSLRSAKVKAIKLKFMAWRCICNR